MLSSYDTFHLENRSSEPMQDFWICGRATLAEKMLFNTLVFLHCSLKSIKINVLMKKQVWVHKRVFWYSAHQAWQHKAAHSLDVTPNSIILTLDSVCSSCKCADRFLQPCTWLFLEYEMFVVILATELLKNY